MQNYSRHNKLFTNKTGVQNFWHSKFKTNIVMSKNVLVPIPFLIPTYHITSPASVTPEWAVWYGRLQGFNCCNLDDYSNAFVKNLMFLNISGRNTIQLPFLTQINMKVGFISICT